MNKFVNIISVVLLWISIISIIGGSVLKLMYTHNDYIYDSTINLQSYNLIDIHFNSTDIGIKYNGNVNVKIFCNNSFYEMTAGGNYIIHLLNKNCSIIASDNITINIFNKVS